MSMFSGWTEDIFESWDPRDLGAVALEVLCDGALTATKHEPFSFAEQIRFHVAEIGGRQVLASFEPGDPRDTRTEEPLTKDEYDDLRRALIAHEEVPMDSDALSTVLGRRTFTCPVCGNSLTLRDDTIIDQVKGMIGQGLIAAGVTWVRLQDLQGRVGPAPQ